MYELTDDTKLFEGWFYSRGSWTHFSYEEIRAQCPLITEAFHPSVDVCGKCAMRGPKCVAQIQGPIIEEMHGSLIRKDWEGLHTAPSLYGPRPENPFEDPEFSLPDGFERVTGFQARQNPSDIIPQAADNQERKPMQLRLSQAALEENAERKQRAVEKGANSRKRHNATCGKGKNACAFREEGCTRWRGRCHRRWTSEEELVTATLEGFEAKFGTTLDRDIEFAFQHASASFDGLSSHSNRNRTMYYRGVTRRGATYKHEIYSQTGYSADREFQGSLEEMMRWLRFHAPHAYVRTWRPRYQQPSTPIDGRSKMLMLCGAEYQRLNGDAVIWSKIGQDYKGADQLLMRTSKKNFVAYGPLWFALNYTWPPHAPT